jgi:uncharacterized membrane protein YjfL (UPF0719 family)
MDLAFFEALSLAVVVCVVGGVLLRFVQRLLHRGRAGLADENPARRLYAALQLAGILWIGASVAHHSTQGDSYTQDLLWALVFGGFGFLLYVLAGQIGVRLLMGRRLADEIDEGNTAAALAAGGHHLAVAVLVGASAVGTDLFGLGLASIFFAAAFVVQQGIVVAFRALTTYDDAEQVAGENDAAALSYVGASVATAIIVARALDGEFEGLERSLPAFLQVASLALVLLPLRQVVVGGVLFGRWPRLRGGPVDDAVGLRHDTAVAALDAAVALAAALAIARLA